jgi:hypothetical protein
MSSTEIDEPATKLMVYQRMRAHPCGFTAKAVHQMVPGESSCQAQCRSIPHGGVDVLSLTYLHLTIAKSALHLLMPIQDYVKIQ